MLIKSKLKDGSVAVLSFLCKSDKTRELQCFINVLVAEQAYILYDKKLTLAEEEKWKKDELDGFIRKQRHIIVARINGKISGVSGAVVGKNKERENVSLGVSVSKQFRSIGLGELLLKKNIEVSKKRYSPKNIYLSVLSENKPARSLYEKLGFRKFAVFPKWIKHKGKYLDQIFMKL